MGVAEPGIESGSPPPFQWSRAVLSATRARSGSTGSATPGAQPAIDRATSSTIKSRVTRRNLRSFDIVESPLNGSRPGSVAVAADHFAAVDGSQRLPCRKADGVLDEPDR